MAHARLSASGSGRWMSCPGSTNFVDQLEADGKIPPDTASDAAMDGTAAHHVAEQCLNDLIQGQWYVSADKYRGYVVDVEIQDDGTEHFWAGDGSTLPALRPGWARFEVDDDMILAVDVLVNHVREVLESFGASEDLGIPPDVEVEIEADADLSFLSREDLGGRIDVRITQLMGVMHVIDYKHGRGIPVYPEKNSQLMIYGLGGDCNADMMPEDVVLTIVQPRCPKNESVESWAISADELRFWGREILLPAAEATDRDSRLNPGEKQCMWCRASGHCDAAHDRALVVASEEFPDDLEPTEENAKKAVLAMDMDRVLRIMAMKGFVEGAIKAATARVISELEAGREVEGWKLVEGKTRRKWIADAEEVLKKKRVPAAIMYNKKLASFAAIEKAEKGKWEKLVTELTEKPAGKATLAPASDKRPALPPPAQEDFDDLPAEEDLLS